MNTKDTVMNESYQFVDRFRPCPREGFIIHELYHLWGRERVGTLMISYLYDNEEQGKEKDIKNGDSQSEIRSIQQLIKDTYNVSNTLFDQLSVLLDNLLQPLRLEPIRMPPQQRLLQSILPRLPLRVLIA